MRTTRCRVCKSSFFDEPLLLYRNMPGAAQFLPDATTIGNDTGIDLEICQCSGCGLVQLSNEPVPYFREVIRATAFSEEMKVFRLKQFDIFAQRYNLRTKKVLEIGCGRGEYLALVQESGMEAYGLEYLHDSVQQCEADGLKVSRGFIEEGTERLENAPFDAFMILNYLEHLPCLNATLKGMHANLKHGGLGLVEVPNFDMIMQKMLFSEFTRDHLFYFTRDTLTTALALNGFDVVECSEVWHNYILSAVVRKRGKLDVSPFLRNQNRLKEEVHRYIKRYTEKKIAVWGAGHQSLAAISMLDLAGSIRYVIDSAPFKQGRYTPATHLPIVAPETLNTDPVEAVLVIAAGYSDEVAKILRERFDQRLDVSILRDYGLEHL